MAEVNEKEIAKKMLLGNLCSTCLWRIPRAGYDLSKTTMDNIACLKLSKIPDVGTCSYWESMDEAIKKGL